MSSSCTVGKHVFAIGYILVSSIFTITIVSLSWSLIRGYRVQKDRQNRPPSWLFYSALIFVLLSIVILSKCIIYGLSLCSYVIVFSPSTGDIVFDMIFADLYVIQLYFLWIVLFIRLYYIFYDTPYALSVVAIRIYSIIFIFSPLLTILLVMQSFYTIFIVLGLSGGIFITLSLIILYIFKLIQVYTRYSEYNGIHMAAHASDTAHNHGLLTTITKNTILIIICTLFSLLILFILIMNFIFSVYAISYGYQQQFLDICLLLDCYITTCCLIFQFKALHSKYEYFCGCVDIICRYYCNQFVNPNIINSGSNRDIHEKTIEKDGSGGKHAVDLRPPVAKTNHHNHLDVPFKSPRDVILSESEASPTDMAAYHSPRYANTNEKNVIEMNPNMNVNANANDADPSASYDTGHPKQYFQDLPSLPLDESPPAAGAGAGAHDSKKKNKIRGSHRAILNNYANCNIHQQQQQQHVYEEKQSELVLDYASVHSQDITAVLLHAGFNGDYISRALAVYVKHYGDEFDLNVIREIIYRLTIKDKIRSLKRVQNLYQSRDSVEDILISLNFSAIYVETALTMYEVMAEMFEINKHDENIYDLELVTEMIMRLRAKDKERGDIKATQEEERDARRLNEIKSQRNTAINTAGIELREENNESEMSSSVDASIPSSKGEEELIQQQQRYQRIQGNIPFIEASTTATHTKDKSLLDVIPASHTKDNSNNLLDVIADRRGGRDANHLHSREHTDSLIEITANTNDMEMDGEEDVRESEEEAIEDDTPIHTMPIMDDNNNKQVAISADQYFDSIIAHNNAELRAHHNMDSKGDNINIGQRQLPYEDLEEEEESFDIQEVYDAYCTEYESVPREPKHLIYFAKASGCEISFTEAITVINANRVPNNNLKPMSASVGGNMKNKSKSFESSNSATPLPADHALANRVGRGPPISNIYSADSEDDGNMRRIQSKIHLNVDKTMDVIDTSALMDDDMDDMMSNDTEIIEMQSSDDTEPQTHDDDESELMDIEDAAAAAAAAADDEYLLPQITQIRPMDPKQNLMPVVVDNVAQHSYEYHNNNVSETQSQTTTSEEEAEEATASEIEYEEEYYEENDVFDEVDDDQTETETIEEADDDDDLKEEHHLNTFYTNATPQQSADTLNTVPIEYDYMERLNQRHNAYVHQSHSNNMNHPSHSHMHHFEITSDNTGSIQSDET